MELDQSPLKFLNALWSPQFNNLNQIYLPCRNVRNWADFYIKGP